MSNDLHLPDQPGCLAHSALVDCLKDLKNNKKFWNRLLDSKWFFWSLTGIIGLFLMFNLWVVSEIYAQKANEGTQKIIAESIYQKLADIKEDSKAVKEELKASEEARTKERSETMKILLDIQKQIRQ